MLAPDDDAVTRVGGFVLRPMQRRTLRAILAALDEFGGVLVADPPGTGKTVLALATAAQLKARDTLVIAPAALRAQWHEAAARAQVAVRFVSVEALSRGASAPPAALVVIDEAHHARTPTTRRYARIAAACRDARVLLLSATPVVNRPADRDALLALFLGTRSGDLTAEQAARCVVRTRESAGRPAVRRLGAIGCGAQVPGLASAITALPPPLPVAEGTPATALVIMSLAMAWRSSLAALDLALRRRLQRGEAMMDLLRSARTPSRAMLRHWVLHDDATQLAMEALLAPATAGLGEPAYVRDALPALRAHLEAVRGLRDLIRPHRADDAERRAAAVRALAAAYPATRLVVFARHAESIRALHSSLRTMPGVVSIVGARVRGAAGRWSRAEVLRALGPRAKPLRADDARAIRILLTTDVVAEGVELQGIGIVVHADVPWTPARLEQRIGRVTRVGSGEREVLEAHFRAPIGARALLRLGSRLRGKHEARRSSTRAAAAKAAIERILERWQGGARRGDAVHTATPRGVANPVVAIVQSAHAGFVALLDDDGTHRWLVGDHRRGRWRVSSAPRRVLRLLRHADGDDADLAPTLAPALARDTVRVIRRVLAARAARGLLVGRAGTPDAHARSATERRIDRVRRRLSRLLERAPALARPALASRLAGWLHALERPLGVARERQLDALLRADLDDARFMRRLGALLSGTPAGNAKSRPGHPGRLDSLLILSRASGLPAVPAPRAASPGTAATR
jgi:superfamily II DNA or RNA helicase